MAIFRQYIAPLLIVLVFLVALLAVGARSFLPGDMASPAPVDEEVTPQTSSIETPLPSASLSPSLSALVPGLADHAMLSPQLTTRLN